MQGTRLSFRSKEDAVHFAEKQGWDYFVYASPLAMLLRRLMRRFCQARARGQAGPSQELLRELPLQTEQAQDRSHEVDCPPVHESFYLMFQTPRVTQMFQKLVTLLEVVSNLSATSLYAPL